MFSSSLLSCGLVDTALIESDAEGIGGSGFVECLREHIHSVSCLFHNVIVLCRSVSIILILSSFFIKADTDASVEFCCNYLIIHSTCCLLDAGATHIHFHLHVIHLVVPHRTLVRYHCTLCQQ